VGNLSSLTKNREQKQSSIDFIFKTKQKVSKKLFQLTIFAFHSNDLELTVMNSLFWDDFFVIE
jgi:hypothetical protein